MSILWGVWVTIVAGLVSTNVACAGPLAYQFTGTVEMMSYSSPDPMDWIDPKRFDLYVDLRDEGETESGLLDSLMVPTGPIAIPDFAAIISHALGLHLPKLRSYRGHSVRFPF